MAEIRPFRGTRYNLERVPDLSQLIIPPYDVIPPEKQKIFYQRHPYNFIHLELGREQPHDTLEANRYTRAADTLRRWWQEGVLICDEEPGIYYYVQEFQLPKRDLLMPGNDTPQRLRRESFICRARLEALHHQGSILPHEQTLAKPKEDRLQLMKACGANLSPILAMYEDPQRMVRTAFSEAVQEPPELDVADDDGVQHQMWRLTDSRILAFVCEAFRPRNLYLLDGHHRYETALAYRDWRRQTEAAAEAAAFDYVLMCLTATDDRGLVVLPTHRLVFGLEPSRFRDLLVRADEFFSRRTCSSPEELVAGMFEGRQRGRVIGAVLVSGYYLLALKEPLDGTSVPSLREPYGKLDVAILHALVLDRLLKISQEDQREQRSLSYVKGVDQVFEGVRSGRFQAGFLLNPTPVSTVQAFAETGAFMPQKSTYFYPKVAAGLVCYEFLQS